MTLSARLTSGAGAATPYSWPWSRSPSACSARPQAPTRWHGAALFMIRGGDIFPIGR